MTFFNKQYSFNKKQQRIFIIYKEKNQLYRLLCLARHFVKNIKFSKAKCKQSELHVVASENKNQENRPLVHRKIVHFLFKKRYFLPFFG